MPPPVLLPGRVAPDGRVHLPGRPTWPYLDGPGGPIIRRILAGGTAVSGGSSVTSLQVTPSGMVEGDGMLAFVATVGGIVTHTGPAGWTEVGTQVVQGNTTAGSLWTKQAGAGEAGPYQWDSSGSVRMAIIVVAYSAADQFDVVVDGSQSSSEGAAAQQLDHDSLTPSGERHWHILATCSNTTAPDDGAVTFAPPAAYAEQAEVASGHATNANVHAALADRELADAAATGVQSVTITGGANRQLVGFEVVLKAAPAATTFDKTLTDAGAGSDALQVAAAVDLADAGVAAVDLAVAAAVPLGDQGLGGDALAVAAGVPLAEQGSASEVLGVAAEVPLPESGAGADALQVSIPRDLADSGAGSDALQVAAAVPLPDQGLAGDALAVAAAIPLPDSGAATDTLQAGIPKTLPDSGAGSDTLRVAAAVPVAEQGAAGDALQVAAAVTLTDGGQAADGVAVGQAKTLTDGGAAGDVLRVAAVVDLADLAAAADSAAAAVLVALADQSSGTDDISVLTEVPAIPGGGVAWAEPAGGGAWADEVAGVAYADVTSGKVQVG